VSLQLSRSPGQYGGSCLNLENGSKTMKTGKHGWARSPPRLLNCCCAAQPNPGQPNVKSNSARVPCSLDIPCLHSQLWLDANSVSSTGAQLTPCPSFGLLVSRPPLTKKGGQQTGLPPPPFSVSPPWPGVTAPCPCFSAHASLPLSLVHLAKFLLHSFFLFASWPASFAIHAPCLLPLNLHCSSRLPHLSLPAPRHCSSTLNALARSPHPSLSIFALGFPLVLDPPAKLTTLPRTVNTDACLTGC